MNRRRAAVLLAVAPLLVAVPADAVRDKVRADFRPRRQAQRWFRRHGGGRNHDPCGLDRDNDGKACEEPPRR